MSRLDRVKRWAALAAPALVGLVLGVLALWPALGPGFVLRYDMVFVPDPPIPAISSTGGGFPRAVPSDLVVALLSSVLPAQIVQKAILLGIFVLAATGAAALVPGERRVARLAAAAFYAWNVYLAQRLLLGQWALLLGYAGLPWAVRAVTRQGVGRTALALLPAAIGGFQAMLVSVMTVLPVAGRRAPRALLVAAVLSLPWLVPALGSAAVTDPAGVRAFAPRADGPLGTLGSLLTLGGVWNAGAAVPGQETWWSALVRLAVAVAAVAGYALLKRGWPLAGRGQGPEGGRGREAGSGQGSGEGRGGDHGDGESGGRPAYWGGLVVASAAGLAVGCAGAFLPGVVEAMVGLWPGFGPLRDGQLYLAPFVLLQAVGLAAMTARLSPAVRPGMLVLPLLVLPTFALGAFGRLAAGDYPPDWSRVQKIVDADPAPGALLTLPWGAYRAFGWNGGRVVLDPAVKLFRRRVVWNDGLPVGLGDGRTLTLATEDPLARGVGAVLAGSGPLTGPLAAEGISHVLIQRSNENLFRARLPGARLVFAGQDLLLFRL